MEESTSDVRGGEGEEEDEEERRMRRFTNAKSHGIISSKSAVQRARRLLDETDLNKVRTATLLSPSLSPCLHPSLVVENHFERHYLSKIFIVDAVGIGESGCFDTFGV